MSSSLRVESHVCEKFNHGIEALLMRGEVTEHGTLAYVYPSAIFVVSCVVLLAGERLIRVTVGLASAAAVCVLIFYATNEQDWPCETQLIVSAVGGLVAGALASFLVKAGIFLFGAASFAAIVHLLYTVWPQLHASQPTFLSRSVSYWACMAVAVVLGGVLVRYHSKPLLQLLTAGAGGMGAAYAVHSMCSLANVHMSIWPFVAGGAVAALGGAWVQRKKLLCRRGGRSAG